MKKITLTLICLAFLSLTVVKAQDTIPNPGFEYWTSVEKPVGWDASNIHTTYLGFPVNVVTTTKDSTNQHSGSYCIFTQSKQIMTGFPVNPGFFTLGTFWFTISPQAGGAKGGIPFVGRPDTLKGFYKGTLGGTDKFTFSFQSWTANHALTVGYDTLNIATAAPAYTEFASPINYSDTFTPPDSMNIIISCSDFYNQTNINQGSSMYVDDLTLVYNNVSVEGFNYTKNFNVYADASDVIISLSFDVPTVCDITIYNISGQMVYNNNLSASSIQDRVGINNLGKGIYIVNVTTDNGQRFDQKIVIK